MSSKAQIYFEKDADLSILDRKKIGVIGYGNQGRAQALNMRDSGLHIIIGNGDGPGQIRYKEKAEADGFDVFTIADAVSKADVLFLLIPDEILQEIFREQIEPNLKIPH